MNRLLSSARASRHLKYGAPFFLFLFGGNYALRQFRSVRYDTDINPKAAQYGKRGVEIKIRSDPHNYAGSCLAASVPSDDPDCTGYYLFGVRFSKIFEIFFFKLD